MPNTAQIPGCGGTHTEPANRPGDHTDQVEHACHIIAVLERLPCSETRDDRSDTRNQPGSPLDQGLATCSRHLRGHSTAQLARPVLPRIPLRLAQALDTHDRLSFEIPER
ncbi:Uncharacterised protein [Mycobacteroides abscessus subsp. massiliense]|nr:Uncharacterised protein [Mycobacteroides abscessus subsp. massiliense]